MSLANYYYYNYTLQFLNTSWIYDDDDEYLYEDDYLNEIHPPPVVVQDEFPSTILPVNATTTALGNASGALGEETIGILGVANTPAAIAEAVVKSVILACMVMLTIGGNVLVLLAVFMSRNLRSSTHYLIVNLAVADLLLGTTVLPFSATLEVSGKWYFGQIFCEVWATADVLCCTASIWSLCVISIDRYIGVTRPLAYSTIMTEKRMCVLIGAVWVLSIVISIGPAFGWKTPPDPDPTVCTVNQELGYVLFSVTGSFYLPSLCILLIYWRIYRTAIQQSKFLEKGIKTTKASVTLRVHKGGAGKSELTLRAHRGGGMGVGIAAGMAAGLASGLSGHLANGQHNPPPPPPPAAADEKTGLRIHRGKGIANLMVPSPNTLRLPVTNTTTLDWRDEQKKGRDGCSGHSPQGQGGSLDHPPEPESPTSSPDRRLPGPPGKMAKFRRQKKAAKTLGIVVGVFLLCWFPFFFILPLDSLCSNCNISETLFAIFFWLGYFNSCLNPFIYAATSREFKRAFKRILCRGGRRSLQHNSAFNSAVWKRATTATTARTPSPARHGLEGLLAQTMSLAEPYGAVWRSPRNLRPHPPVCECTSVTSMLN